MNIFTRFLYAIKNKILLVLVAKLDSLIFCIINFMLIIYVLKVTISDSLFSKIK